MRVFIKLEILDLQSMSIILDHKCLNRVLVAQFIWLLRFYKELNILLNAIFGLWVLYFIKCFLDFHLGKQEINLNF